MNFSLLSLVVFFCIHTCYGTPNLTQLAATVNNLQSKYTTLQSQYTQQQNEIKSLKEKNAASSTYCDLHVNGNCGPCLCKDDFELPQKYYCDCANLQPKRDCLAYYQAGLRVNGLYKVTMNSYRMTQVYCDQTKNGGGWTVIQRRYDGSTNFFRNWGDYKVGFGKLHREFWLGNDNIHLLSVQAIYPKGSEALIDFRTFASSSSYINRYSHFQVDNEKSKYMLHVSGPSGAYVPSRLTNYNNKMEFSTYDRDNDKTSSYNCARDRSFGGWWYYDGTNGAYTNLNGDYDRYRRRSWYQRFNWNTAFLEFSEIKMRRLV